MRYYVCCLNQLCFKKNAFAPIYDRNFPTASNFKKPLPTPSICLDVIYEKSKQSIFLSDKIDHHLKFMPYKPTSFEKYNGLHVLSFVWPFDKNQCQYISGLQHSHQFPSQNMYLFPNNFCMCFINPILLIKSHCS